MFKILLPFLAFLMILIGLVVLPTPMPLGAIMIVTGLVMLISVSDRCASYIRSYRRKHPKVDRYIRTTQLWLPVSWQKIVKRTDP